MKHKIYISLIFFLITLFNSCVLAEICFLSLEQNSSLNKICHYDCSNRTITIVISEGGCLQRINPQFISK